MISNTATPRYYGEFRDKVMSGEIPVCHEIEMQMNRIDALIENPNYYYDDKAIDGFIAFCEEELTLTDGSDLHLLDSFKLWAEDLLAWFYYIEKDVFVPGEKGLPGHYEKKIVKKRLCNKQYLIVSRGAAKSMYAACLQAYWLIMDAATTHQITTSPTVRQSDEVMSPIRTALTRARGPLFKFLTEGSLQNTRGSIANRPKVVSTKKGINNYMTNSLIEARPMSIDKLQGLRCKYCTVDEWLSGDIREDVVGALEQGASKIDDYAIVAISSEGTVRNAAGDDIKLELMKVLRGEYLAPHMSIWYYKLDSIDEVANPDMWVKANPNLGKTVSYQTYQLDVERAEQNPSTRNDILAKRFGIPLEGYTYYFTYEETIPHPSTNLWNMSCSLGADLSLGDDFCAFTFLFPLERGEFAIKARCYISERTYNQLPSSMKVKYDEFISEKTLVVMQGSILDMEEVYEDLMMFISERNYDVRCMGYDPYNAQAFVQRWCRERTEYGVEKVRQGSRTESVPLGELKKLAADRALIFDESICSFTLGNAIAIEDTNGNKKLMKRKSEAKIDVVAAAIDALYVYKLYKDEFY